MAYGSSRMAQFNLTASRTKPGRENGPVQIVTLASFKGGSGKSTAAIAIVSTLIDRQVGSVFLLDLDAQGSSYGWLTATLDTYRDVVPSEEVLDGAMLDPTLSEDEALAAMIDRLERVEASGYGYCIVDTQGAQSALTIAAMQVSDLVLIPMQATGLEIDPFARTVECALESMKVPGARVMGLFTRMPNIVSSAMRTAQEVLEKNDIAILGGTSQRAGYEQIVMDGGTFAMLEAEKIRQAEATEDALVRRQLLRMAEQANRTAKDSAEMLERVGLLPSADDRVTEERTP